MKNHTLNLSKMLLSLFLLIGVTFGTQAQTGPITTDNQTLLRPPLSGNEPDPTPILVHGGNGFTLTASTNSTGEGGEAGIDFTSFDWFIVTGPAGAGDGIVSGTPLESGATPTISGTVGNELSVTGLAPGFYTFSAFGHTEGEICASDPEEFTVFVLAPLVATITASGLEDEYCSDDLPEDATLTAEAAFDGEVAWNTQTPYTSQNPAITDFEFLYQWYKVEDGTTFDPTAATSISGATSASYTLSSADTEVGKWNYYATVTYQVKAAATYTGILGGTTPTVIDVTPKPGKPTIQFMEN